MFIRSSDQVPSVTVLKRFPTERIKIPVMVIIHLGCFALTVAGIIATLRIAFGG